MKNGESLRDRLVKRFFNISGDFDEYKRQETNRIGTNVMMMCLPALLLPPIFASFWATTSPEDALLGIVLFNFIFAGTVILPYLTIARRRAHLTDNEIDANDISAARRHVLKSALGQGLFMTAWMYFLGILVNCSNGSSFTRQLISLSNIKIAVLTGVLVGITMGITYWVRLKKQR